MPALLPVPHVLRVRLAGSLSGVSPWNVLLHWNYSGTQPTSPQLNTISQSIAEAWNTHLAAVHHNTVSLSTVECVDLSAPDAAFGSALVNHAGLLTGTPLPAQVAACVSWKVNFRWRGGHPRSYLPAGTTASTTNQRQWTTLAVQNFETAVNGFFGAVNAITTGAVTGRLCCVRRYSTTAQGQPPTVLDPPLVLDFVSFDVDSRIDTQRRRLGRDVAG